MTDLHSSRFYDLLPPNLRDANRAALSRAFDRQMAALAGYIPIVYMMAMVEDLSEELCDQLALNYNMQEYQFHLPLAAKRELIHFLFQLSARKGTNWAVERLTDAVLRDGETEEWFEYGGEPHFFRVSFASEGNSDEDIDRFLHSLQDVKRKSAWLEAITRRSRTEKTAYAAARGNTRGGGRHRLTPAEKTRAEHTVTALPQVYGHTVDRIMPAPPKQRAARSRVYFVPAVYSYTKHIGKGVSNYDG